MGWLENDSRHTGREKSERCHAGLVRHFQAIVQASLAASILVPLAPHMGAGSVPLSYAWHSSATYCARRQRKCINTWWSRHGA